MSDPDLADQIVKSYEAARGSWDLYMPFVEKALKCLKDGGVCGFLLPVQVLHQENGRSLRRLLLARGSLASIIDFPSNGKDFEGALVRTSALVVSNRRTHDAAAKAYISFDGGASLSLIGSRTNSDIAASKDLSFKISKFSSGYLAMAHAASECYRLDDLCYVTFGLRSCSPHKGGGGKDRLISQDSTVEFAEPYLEARDISAYSVLTTKRWIRYIPKEMYSPRTPALFRSKKIVSKSLLSKKQIIATLDPGGHFVEQSLLCIVPHGVVTPKPPDLPNYPLEYVLACINSTAQARWFETEIVDDSLGGGLVHATPGLQAALLIPKCPLATANHIASLVTSAIAETSAHKKFTLLETIDVQVSKLFGFGSCDA